MTTSNTVAQSGSAPWTRADLVASIRRASEQVIQLPTFPHHLAKASVERWFAFELAAQLDLLIEDRGWTTLVECGAAAGLGNFDLLLVPKTAVKTRERARLGGGAWRADAIAIELKAAHLADGDGGRKRDLLEDLTVKPKRAQDAGHPCAMILGVMITTSGFGKDQEERAAAATKARAGRIAETPLEPGLEVVERVGREVRYQDWNGHVWIEIVVPVAEVSAHRDDAHDAR